MRIFGLNRRIIRVLLGSQYAHMLEYRAEIALWALSGVLPFIMLSVWSGSEARTGLGLDGVALDRYFLSAYLVRQFTVVWVVYAFEEDALLGRLSPYLLQPLHPLWRYVAAHLGEQLTRLPFAALIAAGGEARAVDLARLLGVSHVTVIRTIARLQRDGYVSTEPYRSIFLTEKGARLAADCRERHEVVERFLISLGVPEGVAVSDAEGIEHHCSLETLSAFRQRLDAVN